MKAVAESFEDCFCAAAADVGEEFARAFFRSFLVITSVNASRVVMEASLCLDLGICDDDADDCFAELCSILKRRVPTHAEAAATSPVVTVGQLLRYLHGLGDADTR